MRLASAPASRGGTRQLPAAVRERRRRGRHGGQSARHRLEQRPRQSFGKRGQHEQVCSIEGALHAIAIELAEELDIGREPAPRLRLEIPQQRASADDKKL